VLQSARQTKAHRQSVRHEPCRRGKKPEGQELNLVEITKGEWVDSGPYIEGIIFIKGRCPQRYGGSRVTGGGLFSRTSIILKKGIERGERFRRTRGIAKPEREAAAPDGKAWSKG